MRALIQRVSSASVSVEGELLARIDDGLLLLVGVGADDDDQAAAKLAAKCAQLRVFPDSEGRMNASVLDLGPRAQALCVSQFTLYADTRRGLRPSFSAAARPDAAERLFDTFCERLEAEGVPTHRGRFGAMMSVALVNEGPVTVLVET